MAEQYIAARIAGMLRVELEPPRGLEQAVDAWKKLTASGTKPCSAGLFWTAFPGEC